METEDTVDFVRIPKERIGILIGKSGKSKAKIERYLKIRLEIDSATGEITIVVPPDPRDPLTVLKAKSIVKAIGRGFTLSDALFLLEDNMMLEILDLSSALSSEKAMHRQKSRLIGTEGRTKTFIEKQLGVRIAVYGKTVSIIGPPETIQLAMESVERILSGTPQSAVYHMIEKRTAQFGGF
jgi:ribosomal RNA assembly protein